MEGSGSDFFTSNSELELNLKKHLEAWDVVAARKEIDSEIHQEWISKNAWELVPIITSYMTQEIRTKCPFLIQTCQDLLIIVAERGVAKETLISLLEHVEAFTDNIKFRKVLPSLSLVLRKLKQSSKNLSWSWSFNTIFSHIVGSYEMPDSLGLDEDETILYENDPNVRILIETLEDMLVFLQPIVEEVKNYGDDVADRDQIKLNVVIFILNLFNKPITYLDISWDRERPKSRTRLIVEELVKLLMYLEPNPLTLCTLEERREAKRLRDLALKSNHSDSLQDDNRISNYSIGTLQSAIFAQQINLDQIPQIYNFGYLVSELSLTYVVTLISHKHEMFVIKGLTLFHSLIKRVPTGSFEGSILVMKLHHDFLKSIINVIIYHDSRRYRSLAYENFDLYFKSFKIDARFKFFNFIFEISNHSGLIGIMITKLKDTVLLNLENNINCIETKKYEIYCGNGLKMLFRKVCRLKHGAETDLLEISDEVSSTLNALYAIFKKDSSNHTGIWDLKEELSETYIKDLEKGIDISKAHYNLKLKEKPKMSDGRVEVSLMVGGQPLPNMSHDEMIKVINSALITLELMETSLIRLKKTLEDGK